MADTCGVRMIWKAGQAFLLLGFVAAYIGLFDRASSPLEGVLAVLAALLIPACLALAVRLLVAPTRESSSQDHAPITAE